jgi:hypothetical protein
MYSDLLAKHRKYYKGYTRTKTKRVTELEAAKKKKKKENEFQD